VATSLREEDDGSNSRLLAFDTFELTMARLSQDLGKVEHKLREARIQYQGLYASWLAAGHPTGPGPLPLESLTSRERRVALLAAAGKSNLAIATYLNVSVHTVKSQMKSIFRKLSIRSRAQLPRQ
jgi:DNA-binding NarL/FixJ family response regulator